MFNNFVKHDDKKAVEPFNLIGRRSLIYSKEEAAKILKDNSYYIFVAAAIPIFISIYLFATNINTDISYGYLLSAGIYLCLLGVAIRVFKSRVASILALVSFGNLFISKILHINSKGFFIFVLFVFLAASYRAVRASFFYHKKA